MYTHIHMSRHSMGAKRPETPLRMIQNKKITQRRRLSFIQPSVLHHTSPGVMETCLHWSIIIKPVSGLTLCCNTACSLTSFNKGKVVEVILFVAKVISISGHSSFGVGLVTLVWFWFLVGQKNPNPTEPNPHHAIRCRDSRRRPCYSCIP